MSQQRLSCKLLVLAALGIKGDEATFICNQLRRLGNETRLVELNMLGRPVGEANITSDLVLAKGGHYA